MSRLLGPDDGLLERVGAGAGLGGTRAIRSSVVAADANRVALSGREDAGSSFVPRTPPVGWAAAVGVTGTAIVDLVVDHGWGWLWWWCWFAAAGRSGGSNNGERKDSEEVCELHVGNGLRLLRS